MVSGEFTGSKNHIFIVLFNLFDIFLILYIPDTNLIILKLTEREEISYKNTQRNLILMAP